LLLKAAREYVGPNVVALTFQGPQCPSEDLATARELAGLLGVRHHIEMLDPFNLPDFRQNTPKRCYACKQAIYRRSLEIAAAFEAEAVLDGAHADDAPADRPGLAAAAELGIRSPLREAGLTKAQIRELSRAWGLPGWDLPAQSCLATRFPTYTPLDAGTFRKIDQLESWLRQHGFGPVRMRVHGDLLRLELPPGQWERLLEADMREALHAMAAASGWRYLTLDLLGYQSGSMNEPQEESRPRGPEKADSP
jgi:pyridinium-3,5-biscarboxylic acid mononucleotide sulfurtransferase